MKILLTRIWKKFKRHVDNENHQALLERYDEQISIGSYSILCSLGQRTGGKDHH